MQISNFYDGAIKREVMYVLSWSSTYYLLVLIPSGNTTQIGKSPLSNATCTIYSSCTIAAVAHYHTSMLRQTRDSKQD